MQKCEQILYWTTLKIAQECETWRTRNRKHSQNLSNHKRRPPIRNSSLQISSSFEVQNANFCLPRMGRGFKDRRIVRIRQKTQSPYTLAGIPERKTLEYSTIIFEDMSAPIHETL